MGKYTIFWMFENPRRGRQARNFTTNVSKILDLKSSSEQIFFRKLSLGAPGKGKEIWMRVLTSILRFSHPRNHLALFFSHACHAG